MRRPQAQTVDLNIAALVVPIAAWLLGTLVSLIVLYWVIRLAITGALRSHDEHRAREGGG